MFESRSEAIFIITFPLWVISLVVFLPLTEKGGLLINLAALFITLPLLAINLLSFCWPELFDKSSIATIPVRAASKSDLDKTADDLFNRLKKDMR